MLQLPQCFAVNPHRLSVYAGLSTDQLVSRLQHCLDFRCCVVGFVATAVVIEHCYCHLATAVHSYLHISIFGYFQISDQFLQLPSTKLATVSGDVHS